MTSATRTIFITGASGFVGGAIVRALAGRFALQALSRSEASDAAIRSLGATPVRGQLGSVAAEAISGSDAVIHCAAFVKQWGTREQFWTANVEGTRQLLTAAREAGARRFVHIGTEAALFHGQHMRDIDEAYPYPAHTPFLYSETKAAAEKLVLAAHAPGFATLSIRPRFVWIDHGRSRTSTTHIANLVHAVELALDRGSGGNAYFVTDEGITGMHEFLTALLATRGATPPEKSIPGWLARALATVTDAIWRTLGKTSDPPLTRLAAAMMSRDCTIKTEKAQRDLGYAPVISRSDGLKELSG